MATKKKTKRAPTRAKKKVKRIGSSRAKTRSAQHGPETSMYPQETRPGFFASPAKRKGYKTRERIRKKLREKGQEHRAYKRKKF